MRLVPIEKLNDLYFQLCPITSSRLQRWARKGLAGACKIPDAEGDMFVDLDQFEAAYGPKDTHSKLSDLDEFDPMLRRVLDKLAKNEV